MTSLETRDGYFTRRGRGIEWEMELEWFRRQMPPRAERVVDLGCGCGALLDALPCTARYGLDADGEGLAWAGADRPGIRFICASADKLPFRDEFFDVVTMQHVIEHLADATTLLAECRRVLRGNGVLLLQTPNGQFVDASVFEDPTHMRIFQGEELSRAVERAGFTVLDSRTIGLPWFRRRRAMGSWRLRRMVTGGAHLLSAPAALRWRGQTLCCAARKTNA